MYDLEIESGEPLAGDGDGGEVRQIGPTLLYDAHCGRWTDPLSRVASTLIVTRALSNPYLVSIWDFPADAVGAIAFHPLEPCLLSVSGSRCFDEVAPTASGPGDSDSDSDSESSDESREDVVHRLKERPRPSVRDASIKMWDFGSPGAM